MSGPLEQFQVVNLFQMFDIFGYKIYFTNVALYMMSCLAMVFLVMFLGIRKAELIPGRFQAGCECILDFVRDMMRQNSGSASLRYLPIVFSSFVFVLSCNLSGLMPLPVNCAVTSHFIVNVSLALMLFLLINIIGFRKNGVKMINVICPPGIPKIMIPLMVIVESVSYFVRPFSLALRLGANMIAGHVLLHVVAAFVLSAGVAFPIPFFVTMIIVGFEVFVSLLQAYVFTLLICIYLNDVLDLHH